MSLCFGSSDYRSLGNGLCSECGNSCAAWRGCLTTLLPPALYGTLGNKPDVHWRVLLEHQECHRRQGAKRFSCIRLERLILSPAIHPTYLNQGVAQTVLEGITRTVGYRFTYIEGALNN